MSVLFLCPFCVLFGSARSLWLKQNCRWRTPGESKRKQSCTQLREGSRLSISWKPPSLACTEVCMLRVKNSVYVQYTNKYTVERRVKVIHHWRLFAKGFVTWIVSLFLVQCLWLEHDHHHVWHCMLWFFLVSPSKCEAGSWGWLSRITNSFSCHLFFEVPILSQLSSLLRGCTKRLYHNCHHTIISPSNYATKPLQSRCH